MSTPTGARTLLITYLYGTVVAGPDGVSTVMHDGDREIACDTEAESLMVAARLSEHPCYLVTSTRWAEQEIGGDQEPEA